MGIVKAAAVKVISGRLVSSAILHAGGTQVSASLIASRSGETAADVPGDVTAGFVVKSEELAAGEGRVEFIVATSTNLEPVSSRRLCFSELRTELPSGPLPTANFILPKPMTWPGITTTGGLFTGGSRMTVAAAAVMLLIGLPPPPRLNPTASLSGTL